MFTITLSSIICHAASPFGLRPRDRGGVEPPQATAAAFHALSLKCHLSSGLSVVVFAAGRKCFPLQQTPPINNNINYQCTCCLLFWGTIVSLSRVSSSWTVIEIHSQSDINISLVLVSYLISRTRRCRSRGPWSQVLMVTSVEEFHNVGKVEQEAVRPSLQTFWNDTSPSTRSVYNYLLVQDNFVC